MGTLWYALFRGELCRIRRTADGLLVTEIWRNATWGPGPDFSRFDFEGRMIFEDEAQEWIRSRFREKRVKPEMVTET